MENLFHLELASRTDPGQVRTQNEDSIAHNLALGLAILADGMGGYNAGEVASGMATALLKSELENALPKLFSGSGSDLHKLLRDSIQAANTAIFQMAISRQQYNGMGTTLVLTVFHGQTLTVAHLGDSRLYRWRANQFEQITLDHSVLQEQINAGVLSAEQARNSLHKNLVTRALGVHEIAQPDITDLPIHAGDMYLLCSDGLSDMVDDQELAKLLTAHGADLDFATQELIRQANLNGGRDNVSAILVKVVANPNAPPSLVSRFLQWLK